MSTNPDKNEGEKAAATLVCMVIRSAQSTLVEEDYVALEEAIKAGRAMRISQGEKSQLIKQRNAIQERINGL